MKIGIVCYPSVGGSGVVATELGHQLALLGHDIHFITYETPFRLRLDEKNITFHKVEINGYELFKYPDYALTLATKLADVAREFDLDIIHVHYAIPHATSAYLAKQILGTKRPAVVTTLHGTDITVVGQDPAYLPVVKYSLDKSSGVTAVSRSLRDETCELFEPKGEVDVIYNFFSPQEKLVGKKPMRHLYVEEGEKLLLHASNFRPVKRIEDVIHIFQKVKEKIPSKLLLIGSGSEKGKAIKMVQELNLVDSVFFQSDDREIDPYIASADLFLLPSAYESFGLVALEAMAYGVPVIATDVGGIPEVVIDGEAGFLAPVGEVQQMADLAIQLLSDSDLYQKMSQAGKKRVSENFSVSKILPQYISYYEKVLSS